MDTGHAMKLLKEAFARDGAGDLEGARRLATAALQEFGDDRTGAAAAHHLLGMLLARTGEAAEALEHIDAALPLRSSTGDLEGGLALEQLRFELLVALGKPARESASRVVAAAEKGGGREELARALYQLASLGDDDALASVERGLAYCDRAGEERARSALLILRSRYEEEDVALGTLRHALQVARSAKSRLAVAQALLALAPREEDPLPLLNEALDAGELLRSDDLRVQALRALARFSPPRRALDHLAYAAQLAEGDLRRTLLMQASQTASSVGATARAVDHARELVAACEGEEKAMAQFILGQALVADGKYRDALQHFTEAATAQPSGAAWAMAGQLHAALGAPEEARAAYQEALRVCSPDERSSIDALLEAL